MLLVIQRKPSGNKIKKKRSAGLSQSIEQLLAKSEKQGNLNVTCVNSSETEPFSYCSPQSAKCSLALQGIVFKIKYE